MKSTDTSFALAPSASNSFHTLVASAILVNEDKVEDMKEKVADQVKELARTQGSDTLGPNNQIPGCTYNAAATKNVISRP